MLLNSYRQTLNEAPLYLVYLCLYIRQSLVMSYLCDLVYHGIIIQTLNPYVSLIGKLLRFYEFRIIFLNLDNKTKLVPAYFSFFLDPL